ncbi:MAG TPA: hypothetical protein ENL18_01120, partial [Thermoplasmatales archaeon]|nr:hypothetical protein [Thermoplasmatales archaeon]
MMGNKFTFAAMLILLVGFVSPAFSNLQVGITGPYTQNVTENSITIVWETSIFTTNNSIEYGENESYGYIKYATGGSHHEVTVNPPFSSGHYRVVSDGTASRDLEFKLASSCRDRGHFKAAIFGDSRGVWDNWAHAREVADA